MDDDSDFDADLDSRREFQLSAVVATVEAGNTHGCSMYNEELCRRLGKDSRPVTGMEMSNEDLEGITIASEAVVKASEKAVLDNNTTSSINKSEWGEHNHIFPQLRNDRVRFFEQQNATRNL